MLRTEGNAERATALRPARCAIAATVVSRKTRPLKCPVNVRLTASRLSVARMTDPRAPAHRPRQGTAAQTGIVFLSGRHARTGGSQIHSLQLP